MGSSTQGKYTGVAKNSFYNTFYNINVGKLLPCGLSASSGITIMFKDNAAFAAHEWLR